MTVTTYNIILKPNDDGPIYAYSIGVINESGRTNADAEALKIGAQFLLRQAKALEAEPKEEAEAS